MKTLYLHIGTPKTGTSAIQELCVLNQETLNKKGYCYPVFKTSYAGFSKRRNGMFLQKSIYKDGVRQTEEEKKFFEENMNEVFHLFKTYDNVILSDEGIWAASYELRRSLWKDLKELGGSHDFAVKVIVYLRRQDVYMVSIWKQRVKGNALKKSDGDIPWEEYIANVPENLQLDYYAALERISAALGKENIIVRRYERGSFPDGLIQADFLKVIGLELTDEYVLEKETVNQSLSGNTCEIKRVVNTLEDITEKESLFLRRALLGYSRISEEAYPRSMFSVQEAKDFMEKFRQGNRKVAKEYMNEPDGELFEMSFPDAEKWEKDNPYMLDDVIRFAAESDISVLRRMEEENKALKDELKSLRTELDGLKNKLRHPLKTGIKILLKKRK